MDALVALHDSQVVEDDAVAVLQCSQQYDDAVELDESAFHVVSIEPARQIEDIRPMQLPENHQFLAVDLLNAFNAAPRQLAEEPEVPHRVEAIVPAEGIVPDEERKVRPLYHRMIGRSRSRSTGRSEVPEVEV